MTILTGFATVQANMFEDAWQDFKDTAKALGTASKDTVIDSAKLIKANTWDLKIGSCENGGKVVCCTLAAIIIADQAYCWYVNREIMKEFNERKKLAHQTPQAKSPAEKQKSPAKKQIKKPRGA